MTGPIRRARGPALCFVAGLAHAGSFAPLGQWWLQPLALAALLWLACGAPDGEGRRGPAIAGLSFGFAWFLSGVAWLFVSMHRYGGMPSPMAATALALFALYLGAFAAGSLALAGPAMREAMALAAGSGRSPSSAAPHPPPPRPARAALRAALLFSACWGAGEMLRGRLFTGFPWLSSGYAHVDGPLAGLAPIVAVHGIGAMAALVAAGLAIGFAALRRKPSRAEPAGAQPPGAPPAGGTKPVRPTLAIAAACIALPLALGLGLAPVHWSRDTGEPVRVRLLQGNVPQQLKFDPDRSVAAMVAYARAIVASPADLVVLPETAWTVPWSRTPPSIVEFVVDALRRSGGVAAIGMPLPATARDGSPTLANSVSAIGAQGPLAWRYDKRHLVPFGEFVPFGFRWFVRMMHIPLGDFGRGAPHQPSLDLRGQRFAFNICYEDIFGEELVPQVRDGATILVNISNIAWFGDSHALPQHLQIARMRAIELARPMLRATNTGMTAAIDARGRVVAALAPYTEDALAVELRGASELTPYARAGDLAPLALIALLAAGAFALRERRQSAPPPAR